jgi:hypothetical protein
MKIICRLETLLGQQIVVTALIICPYYVFTVRLSPKCLLDERTVVIAAQWSRVLCCVLAQRIQLVVSSTSCRRLSTRMMQKVLLQIALIKDHILRRSMRSTHTRSSASGPAGSTTINLAPPSRYHGVKVGKYASMRGPDAGIRPTTRPCPVFTNYVSRIEQSTFPANHL